MPALINAEIKKIPRRELKEKDNGPFDALPDGWRCPTCGVSKDSFERI